MSKVFGFAALLIAVLSVGCAQSPVQPSLTTAISHAAVKQSADYGSGALFEVEISANLTGPQGGGIWLWIELTPNAGTTTAGTGNYAGADCGHGQGAVSDKGDVTWVSSGGKLTISGVNLMGLGGIPITITVPSTYGHYPETFGSTFAGLPPFVPSNGPAQVQVAP